MVVYRAAPPEVQASTLPAVVGALGACMEVSGGVGGQKKAKRLLVLFGIEPKTFCV